MIYLSDLVDKEVESVEPYKGQWGELPSIATVEFTDGTRLGVFIDSREFHYNGTPNGEKSETIRTCDLDAITTDRFFKGGVIRTPEPPKFRWPKDPVLCEIVKAFAALAPKLMEFHGGGDRTEAKFLEIVRPWEQTVKRFYGYRRGNNLTSPTGVFIQANERRPKWLLKLSNWLPIRKSETISPR